MFKEYGWWNTQVLWWAYKPCKPCLSLFVRFSITNHELWRKVWKGQPSWVECRNPTWPTLPSFHTSFMVWCEQHFISTNWNIINLSTDFRVWFLVVPFPPCGPPRLACLLAWTLVLGPCCFSSPFLGCFLFIKFGRVSSL